MQWGTIYNAKAGANDNNNNNNAVTFPMPFTTVFALSPTFIIEANHGNRDVIVNLYSLSNTGAVIRCWDADNATNDGQLTYIALGKQQWGIITCTTGKEGEFIFPISFTTKCLSFIASASIPADLCTITTAKFIAHDMNYGVEYKADAFGLFIGI